MGVDKSGPETAPGEDELCEKPLLVRAAEESGVWVRKYFWEGQRLTEAATKKLEAARERTFFQRHRRWIALLVPALLFHVLWWSWMGSGDLFHLFTERSGDKAIPRYYMSITMWFGSMVAGATSEGGASIAFPVMTLVFSILPAVARDFSFMVQSVGLTSAAVTILLMGLRLELHSLVYCTIGGMVGIVFGLETVAPALTPSYSKMYFVVIWFAFAFSLYWLNRNHGRRVFDAIPDFDTDKIRIFGRGVPWKALVLLAFGFVGGIFSSIAGSGIDICCFSALTLLFRVSEKIATPTSVVLMAINAVVGFVYREFAQGGVEEDAWGFFAVCVPIVAIGAPLGSLLGSHFHRLALAAFIYLTDTAQLVLALVVVKPWLHAKDGGKEDNDDPVRLTLTSAAILVAGAIFFKLMEVAGRRLLGVQEAKIAAKEKWVGLGEPSKAIEVHGGVTKPARRSPLTYEALVWVVFVAITAVVVADRFVWNAWPRQTHRIGAGFAGSDKIDGLKEGPWTVKFYDIVARVSGRYTILALNLLLFTMMKSSQAWVAEAGRFSRWMVDFSDVEAGNRRLHVWNGILIAGMTLVHVWSILVPVVVNGYGVQVRPGKFEWPLSERKPSGFKDVSAKNEMVMLQVDDVWRIVEMTVLLGVLLPLSYRYFATRWHFGIQLHTFIMLMYFVDIVRRHTHPHSMILNIPAFVAWVIDRAVVGHFWRRNDADVHCIKLSQDYMLLFWAQPQSSPLTSPKYFLRLRDSGLMERPHVFTGFENRCGLDLAQGREWTSGVVARVYNKARKPRLGRRDKKSHTGRMYDVSCEGMTSWGPFPGEMSENLDIAMRGTDVLTLVAGGSGAAYLIDAMQRAIGQAECTAPLRILCTTRDGELARWVTRWLRTMSGMAPRKDLRAVIALTGVKEGTELGVDGDGDGSGEGLEASRAGASEELAVRMIEGRLDFSEQIESGSMVFFNGSPGLLEAVKRVCQANGNKLVEGAAFDKSKKTTVGATERNEIKEIGGLV